MHFLNNPNGLSEFGNNTNPLTALFIPCCKGKRCTDNPATRYDGQPVNLTQNDIPNQWHNLIAGRQAMSACIYKNSHTITAINLYDGYFYRAIDPNWGSILNMVEAGWLRIFIMSACYGIIDIRESIQDYEAQMRGGKTRCKYRPPCEFGATIWNHNHLEEIICDLLMTLKPEIIFGYFTGGKHWNDGGAKYRYFFYEGLNRALTKGLNPKYAGCFFKQNGQGTVPILRCLASTLVQHSQQNFNCNYGLNLIAQPLNRGNVAISYDSIP